MHPTFSQNPSFSTMSFFQLSACKRRLFATSKLKFRPGDRRGAPPFLPPPPHGATTLASTSSLRCTTANPNACKWHFLTVFTSSKARFRPRDRLGACTSYAHPSPSFSLLLLHIKTRSAFKFRRRFITAIFADSPHRCRTTFSISRSEITTFRLLETEVSTWRSPGGTFPSSTTS